MNFEAKSFAVSYFKWLVGRVLERPSARQRMTVLRPHLLPYFRPTEPRKKVQAGPGRTVRQEQEDISRNHVQAFIPDSVHTLAAKQGQKERYLSVINRFRVSF